MKQTTFVIFVFFYSITYSQQDAIEQANKLIGERKYESAMKILNTADPDNQNPDIVIAKTELLLNYFTKSIMHNLFGLKDLKPNEDLMELRGGSGEFTMFAFYPDSVLIHLIDTYPDNYNLRKTLGNYYQDVYIKYSNSWLEPDSVLIQKFKYNYLTAFNHGVFDYWSLYGIAYGYLIEENYQSAIPFFEKSITLKKDYASSYYNLAYAYLYTNQQEKGISNAIKAMDLYDDFDYKADAAVMIGAMYRELDQEDKALEYYYQANKIRPNDYYTLKPIIELETKLNKDSYLLTTKNFFLLAPDNPTIYQDLLRTYLNNNKPDELINFLEARIPEFQKDNKISGNLFFYIATIQFEKTDYDNAKTNFLKAQDIFKKVFSPNHKVFEVIDSYLANCK